MFAFCFALQSRQELSQHTGCKIQTRKFWSINEQYHSPNPPLFSCDISSFCTFTASQKLEGSYLLSPSLSQGTEKQPQPKQCCAHKLKRTWYARAHMLHVCTHPYAHACAQAHTCTHIYVTHVHSNKHADAHAHAHTCELHAHACTRSYVHFCSFLCVRCEAEESTWT